MKRLFKILFFICSLFITKQAFSQMNYSISYSSTCVGTAIQFNSNVFETAPFPDSVKWNFGDTASGMLNTANGILQPTHIYNLPGTYIVTLHVVDGGAGTIDLTDTINFVLPVVHNFGPDVFLCGDTGTYIINAPAIPNAIYEWNDDTTTLGPVLAVKESGTYTVKINGCQVTDTIGVFFSREPELNLGNNHIMCNGEQITLDASSENATYQWYLNGANLNFSQSQLPVTAPGGNYVVQVNVPGCGNYTDSVNISFSNYTAPSFSLGPDTLLCPKETYLLHAHANGATSYVWGSKGLDIDDAVNNNIGTDSFLRINNAGRYWAFVTIAKTCEVVDTTIVRYRGNKQLNFNDTALCQGNTLILDADFGTGIYKWEAFPPQRDDQNNTNQSTYYIYSPGFFTVTAQVGHCIFKDSLNVVFNDTLQLALPKDTTLCQGETFIITPTANTTDYTWQDGSKTTTYTALRTGMYSIIAKNGCGADTAQMNIVFNPCPCALLLPNTFTPNGDGLNDNFRPLHACDMENYSMTIFNRYGEKIYFSNDPLQGWDGKIKGSLLNMGTYVWFVSYIKTSTQELIQKKGSVLLLR
ncbi:MAG: gliding motility-associated C-terminal domain-containing protein [Ferruginibacter sp.]|nr:gliding motility-associated C-terminal domain-containing protein [Bacteroidota bacterium]MBX2917851.1 gliding motility-associated C-terminal domain-containing protein [Ferruginibacter sp.]MCB0708663.1 gliding motility-associated C-terminal domain-containing protein [Chitinophagaceae bacterium]MCC7379945.1 gliding motility-associated C-terminal domain-containing protein [Chitinophagaceae bacterium]